MLPVLTKSVGLLASLALFSGCATIVSGTKQPIRISSEPSGANVRVDGVVRATTPAELELSVTSGHLVRVELAGYQPYEVELKRKMNGWVFGNIFFGGLLGVIIDASTGAMYGLTPDEIDAHLEASGRGGRARTTSADRETIYVATTLQANPKWTKVGQLARR